MCVFANLPGSRTFRWSHVTPVHVLSTPSYKNTW